MSDEKTFTQRDLVLAQREAFKVGVRYAAENGTAKHADDGPCHVCDIRAEKKFPLPPITRPRVVTDSRGVEWCFRTACVKPDGALLMARRPGGNWINDSHERYPSLTLTGYQEIADLFQNPTESAEDDS